MVQTVYFSSYNSDWPFLFEKESMQIKKTLGNNCIEIHHIGSTSVPGLSAKPIIDMLLVVKDILKVQHYILDALGYVGRGELGMPFRRYFSNKDYHVQIWEEGADEIQKQLLFRNYLRTHSKARETYQALKAELAETFKKERSIYTAKKDPFIKEILRKAGFNRFEFVHPVLEEDWDHYHRIRREQIFSRYSHIIYNPNHPTLNDPAHFHFILKKLDIVIGVTHVELLKEHRAALRLFAIDAPYQRQGYGSYLLKLVEKWVMHQKCTFLQLHANPSALTFYQRAGYKTYPFPEDDRDRLLKNCVDLIKNLSS